MASFKGFYKSAPMAVRPTHAYAMPPTHAATPNVSHSMHPPLSGEFGSHGPPLLSDINLTLSNLPKDTTDDELVALLRPFGDVRRVNIRRGVNGDAQLAFVNIVFRHTSTHDIAKLKKTLSLRNYPLKVDVEEDETFRQYNRGRGLTGSRSSRSRGRGSRHYEEGMPRDSGYTGREDLRSRRLEDYTAASKRARSAVEAVPSTLDYTIPPASISNASISNASISNASINRMRVPHNEAVVKGGKTDTKWGTSANPILKSEDTSSPRVTELYLQDVLKPYAPHIFARTPLPDTLNNTPNRTLPISSDPNNPLSQFLSSLIPSGSGGEMATAGNPTFGDTSALLLNPKGFVSSPQTSQSMLQPSHLQLSNNNAANPLQVGQATNMGSFTSIIWSGILARNEKKRISVNAFALKGNAAVYLSKTSILNVSHRLNWDEVAAKCIVAVCYFDVVFENQKAGFVEYINYFISKGRAGVITLDKDTFLYLVPPKVDLFKQFQLPPNTPEQILIGLVVPSQPPPDPSMAKDYGTMASQQSVPIAGHAPSILSQPQQAPFIQQQAATMHTRPTHSIPSEAIQLGSRVSTIAGYLGGKA